MKRYLIALILSCVASTAFASKARLAALGQTTDLTSLGIRNDGSLLFKDNRNIFLNPAQAAQMGNIFNFEMGASNSYATNPIYFGNAEGGLVYQFHNGKLGFQMGRRMDISNSIVFPATGVTSGLLPPKDTFDIVYAHGKNNSWGFGLHYGDAKNDPVGAGDEKSSYLVVTGGCVRDRSEYYVHVGLMANAEDTIGGSQEKYEGKGYLKAGMSYKLNDVAKLTGMIFKNGYDYTTAGGTKTENNALVIDLRYNRVHTPKNDLMFFYGGGLTNVTADSTTAGTKTDITVQQIPMFIGLEGSATSWLDLRASVTQAVILNSMKFGTETQHHPNSTTVGAGATMKFNNFTMDATLAGATTGTIDGTSLLANASLLYNF